MKLTITDQIIYNLVIRSAYRCVLAIVLIGPVLTMLYTGYTHLDTHLGIYRLSLLARTCILCEVS